MNGIKTTTAETPITTTFTEFQYHKLVAAYNSSILATPSTMKNIAIFLTAIASATYGVFAADCGNKFKGVPDSTHQQDLWNIRSIVCTCIGNKSGGYCANSPGNIFQFAIWGTFPSEQLCLDAFDDIINQCMYNGWNSGLYNYEGSSFQITRNY